MKVDVYGSEGLRGSVLLQDGVAVIPPELASLHRYKVSEGRALLTPADGEAYLRRLALLYNGSYYHSVLVDDAVTQEYSPSEARDDHGKWTSDGAKYLGDRHYGTMSHAERASYHHAMAARHSGHLREAHRKQASFYEKEPEKSFPSHEETLARRHATLADRYRLDAQSYGRRGETDEALARDAADLKGAAETHRLAATEHAALMPPPTRDKQGIFRGDQYFSTRPNYYSDTNKDRAFFHRTEATANARLAATDDPVAARTHQLLAEMHQALAQREDALPEREKTWHHFHETAGLLRGQAAMEADPEVRSLLERGAEHAQHEADQIEKRSKEHDVFRAKAHALAGAHMSVPQHPTVHTLNRLTIDEHSAVPTMGGMSDSYLMRGTDPESGREVRVFVKPIKQARTPKAWPIERRTDTERELAAYHISRVMGEGYIRVPHATVRDTPKGAAYVSLAQRGKDGFNGNEHRVAVYDTVIGNLDRHSGNLMTTDKGEMVAIDQALSLPDPARKPDWHNDVKYSSPLQRHGGEALTREDHVALENLTKNEAAVRTYITGMLGASEPISDDLFRRVRWMQQHNRLPHSFVEINT